MHAISIVNVTSRIEVNFNWTTTQNLEEKNRNQVFFWKMLLKYSAQCFEEKCAMYKRKSSLFFHMSSVVSFPHID